MSTGLVSVVIPTFNRARIIRRAIESAARQTYPHVEIVVVDDGSSDDTPALLERLCKEDPRIVYIRQENRGVSGARNTGIEAARGDYLALLDSDDRWKPWKLELQLRCLDHFRDAGMVWTDMEAVDPEGQRVSPRFLRTMYQSGYRWFPTSDTLFSQSIALEELGAAVPAEESRKRAYVGDLSSAMIMGNLVHTSTVLLRRERLAHVRRFDERLRYSGEDFDFHLRTCRAGPVAFADVASIEYQVGHADQLTRPELAIHMARNFLRTIEPYLADGARGVDLPREMLAAVLADAHGWVGRESLRHGDRAAARKHLRESLRHRALAPKTIAFLALAYGPPFAFPAAQRAVRMAKRARDLVKKRT
jgi:GT2 family glycosyltransferase